MYLHVLEISAQTLISVRKAPLHTEIWSGISGLQTNLSYIEVWNCDVSGQKWTNFSDSSMKLMEKCAYSSKKSLIKMRRSWKMHTENWVLNFLWKLNIVAEVYNNPEVAISGTRYSTETLLCNHYRNTLKFTFCRTFKSYSWN